METAKYEPLPQGDYLIDSDKFDWSSIKEQYPDEWKDDQVTFHNPIIFVPRLGEKRWSKVAKEIGARLTASTKGKAHMMLPLLGTSRYSVEGGPLCNPDGDLVFFKALKKALPDTVTVEEFPFGAEADDFVDVCVDRLIELIEAEES